MDPANYYSNLALWNKVGEPLHPASPMPLEEKDNVEKSPKGMEFLIVRQEFFCTCSNCDKKILNSYNGRAAIQESTRTISRNQWTEEEDKILLDTVNKCKQEFNKVHWNVIYNVITLNRSIEQCISRYYYLIKKSRNPSENKPKIVKWTPIQYDRLYNTVNKYFLNYEGNKLWHMVVKDLKEQGVQLSPKNAYNRYTGKFGSLIQPKCEPKELNIKEEYNDTHIFHQFVYPG